MTEGRIERRAQEKPASPINALIVTDGEAPDMVPQAPFDDAGVGVLYATGFDEARSLFAETAPEIVFVPVALDGRSIRPVIEHFLATRSKPLVIVIASNDQINAAAEAMRAGAFDCLFRPFSPARLAKMVQSALKALPTAPRARARSGRAVPVTSALRIPSSPSAPLSSRTMPKAAAPPQRLIADSQEMQAVLKQLEAIAPSDAPVFLTGELGTGKSCLAQALHDRSRRAGAPFVRVDCATLTPTQFEALLTGPGGAMNLAARGTVLLHEVCELPQPAQTQLLQAVDRAAALASDDHPGPRLVSTTRHDPRAAIRGGRLRSDLFYRLHVAPIAVPPLRRRRADIAPLAQAQLEQIARAEGRSFTGFASPTLPLLEAYDWPGNVRELTNVIWSIVLLNEGPLVTPTMLPPDILAPARLDGPDDTPTMDGLIGKTLDEIERQVIEATIRAEGGSVPQAARVLGVAPSTLYRKRDAWDKT